MEIHTLPENFGLPSPTSTIAYIFLIIYGIHLALVYFDVPVLSLRELIWNVAVYSIPAPLLLDSSQRRELRANGMTAQMHAAKSEALRHMMKTGGKAILQQSPSVSDALVAGTNCWSSAIGSTPAAVTSKVPAGLGNWDNSCYQNSVLQALTALNTISPWLLSAQQLNGNGSVTTGEALQELMAKLRDFTNNGKHLWTPAKLKSMSSWQQQDAQEYFSKVMDELDKEAAKAEKSKMAIFGLEALLKISDQSHAKDTENGRSRNDHGTKEKVTLRNPLEGWIAQRITCTTCKFSEGYSMIPFNCLTVPLGSLFDYTLEDCLTEYTKMEAITGVECRRCTLLRAEDKLKTIIEPNAKRTGDTPEGKEDKSRELPLEVRVQINQRLHAIQTALSEDDYSDKTLKQDCSIPPKSYVSSTKTREALIGRAPQALVVHINRSVFDEMTGMQRKNYAQVRYPLTLNLKPWTLGIGNVAADYHLRAAVTHYGRHENGHYICYRQHPPIDSVQASTTESSHNTSDGSAMSESPRQWWRLSDQDVSSVTEEDVLKQGGAFMLFYERDTHHSSSAEPLPITTGSCDVLHSLNPEEPPQTIPSSSQSITSESDTEIETENASSFGRLENARPHAPIMRTAAPTSVRHDISFGRSMMSY